MPAPDLSRGHGARGLGLRRRRADVLPTRIGTWVLILGMVLLRGALLGVVATVFLLLQRAPARTQPATILAPCSDKRPGLRRWRPDRTSSPCDAGRHVIIGVAVPLAPRSRGVAPGGIAGTAPTCRSHPADPCRPHTPDLRARRQTPKLIPVAGRTLLPHPHHGRRIGEAGHPGPVDVQDSRRIRAVHALAQMNMACSALLRPSKRSEPPLERMLD